MHISNKIVKSNGIAFDDVLIIPTYSEIESRLHPKVETNIGKIKCKIPMISSPMNSVTEHDMAISIGNLGGIGVVHRFMSTEKQIDELYDIRYYNEENNLSLPIVPAIGVGKDEQNRFNEIYSEFGNSISMISIDVANGHSLYMKNMIEYVNDKTGGSIDIMAGNIATGEGYEFLSSLGVAAVRAGIGCGSICKTRIMTGIGVPLLSTLFQCYSVKQSNGYKTAIIADGGIRYPGDLTKSIAAGADAIMCGNIFAGTDESPGSIINIDDKLYKPYYGMASVEAQKEYRGGLKSGTCAEGVSTYIECKGKLSNIVDEFIGGLKSGMTYVNANSLEQLRENSRFMMISDASLSESHAFGTRK